MGRKGKDMVTLKEIAQRCNVSVTTVSNILNGKPKVSEETKKMVMDVVAELGYQPNYIAQGLRRQKTHTIGIIADDIAEFSTPKMIESIMACCEDKGYRTVVQNLRLFSRWVMIGTTRRMAIRRRWMWRLMSCYPSRWMVSYMLQAMPD